MGRNLLTRQDGVHMQSDFPRASELILWFLPWYLTWLFLWSSRWKAGNLTHVVGALIGLNLMFNCFSPFGTLFAPSNIGSKSSDLAWHQPTSLKAPSTPLVSHTASIIYTTRRTGRHARHTAFVLLYILAPIFDFGQFLNLDTCERSHRGRCLVSFLIPGGFLPLPSESSDLTQRM
jgi:hypothetical protein